MNNRLEEKTNTLTCYETCGRADIAWSGRCCGCGGCGGRGLGINACGGKGCGGRGLGINACGGKGCGGRGCGNF